MTVAQLIEELSALSQDSRVNIETQYENLDLDYIEVGRYGIEGSVTIVGVW